MTFCVWFQYEKQSIKHILSQFVFLFCFLTWLKRNQTEAHLMFVLTYFCSSFVPLKICDKLQQHEKTLMRRSKKIFTFKKQELENSVANFNNNLTAGNESLWQTLKIKPQQIRSDEGAAAKLFDLFFCTRELSITRWSLNPPGTRSLKMLCMVRVFV